MAPNISLPVTKPKCRLACCEMKTVPKNILQFSENNHRIYDQHRM